jgi:outer membrane protein TolC
MLRALVGLAVTVAISLNCGYIQDASATESMPERPLSLSDCVAIALRNNPQLVSSAQGVVSARAGLTKARSSYYPQLALSATEALARNATGTEGAQTQSEVDLTSALTLWQPGRQESVAQSRALLQASEESYASTVQSLVSQVAGDYYAALAAGQLVGVAEAGVESAQAHLDQVNARIALGATAEVDAFTAESDLAQAQLDLIDARSGLKTTFAQLKNTLGVGPEITFELAEEAAPEAMPTPSLADALSLALERRPEILAGRASVLASRYALSQAQIRRGPLPEVAAEFGQGFTDWDARDATWAVALSLSWPLFDGYSSKADVEAAQADAARAEADRRQSVNQVGLEVETAVVEAQRTRERVEGTAKLVRAAEARLAAAEGKYQQGMGILIEVTDARAAVTNARAGQVRARYDYQTALVSLQRAMGTLAAPAGGTQ